MIQIRVNLIVMHDGRVLVMKRSKEDGGFWQTLTGTVAYDETIEQAIKREVYEETGLEGESSYPELIHSFVWKKGTSEVIEIVLSFKAKSNNVKLSEEHTEFRWVSPKEAMDIVEKENNKIALKKL